MTVRFEAFASVANGAGGSAAPTFRHGTGAPSNALGVNGDFYGDDSTGNVYQKAAGVYAIVGTLGPTRATSFSDNFTRANSASWGDSYAQEILWTNNGTAYSNTGITSNKGRITGLGSAGHGGVFSMPRSLLYLADSPVNHYAEATPTNNNGTSFTWYLAVCCDVSIARNNGAAYGAYILANGGGPGGQINLQRWTMTGDFGNGPSSTAIQSNIAAWNLNDVLRLEATYAAGVWTLTVKKNAAQIFQTTDSNLLKGTAGLGAAAFTAGNWIEWGSFNAGLL